MTAHLSPHTSLAAALCLFSLASATQLQQVFAATCFSLCAEMQASKSIFSWLVTARAQGLSIGPTAQRSSSHKGRVTSPIA